jgi:NADH-quinone oxidoreductase subunit A
MYLTNFGIVLVFFIVGVLFVAVGLFFSALIRPNHPTKEKLMTYESGEVAVGSPWIQFNNRFYIIGLAYLIFDVELVLLFPWAIVYKSLGWYSFFAMVIFVTILILGLVYDWAKGYLEWDKPDPIIPKLEELIIKRAKKDK